MLSCRLHCLPHPRAPACIKLNACAGASAVLHGCHAELATTGCRRALLQEVQQSTQQLVCAAVRGAAEGASSGSGGGSGQLLEQLLGALASERGSSILTLAISVACRCASWLQGRWTGGSCVSAQGDSKHRVERATAPAAVRLLS